MSGHVEIGLGQQAHRIPTLVVRQLQREDRSGICDTCPGELDRPETVYQTEPGEPAYWHVIGIMAGVGLAAVLMVHLLARTGSLP
ncbi:hypothetical protein OU995_11755 [Roseateles sp. SL47]|uniref:hypothetical protein n=1 Tax=Roseateles sp. SL47 TaxID=2995138 RepID=UPI00226DFCEA|nr:hypothetical protein [Roseateles sp. SL47]WAC75323.1 hypothetical protein OU995_11755 [Roseateles sp. SL47]